MTWLRSRRVFHGALLGLALALVCCMTAAPASAAPVAIKATVGMQFSGELADVQIENVEGADCTGDAHEATGTIAWGDGVQSSLTGSEFVFEGEDAVHLSGAHTYTQAGQYEGTIKGDYQCLNSQQSYEAKFSAVVKNTVTGETGVEFSEVVAVVTASQCTQNSSSPVGTIAWGDGTSSPAQLAPKPQSLGTYLVTGKHAYLKPGVYKGSFTGSYKCNGGSGTGNFAAAVFTAEITGAEKPTTTITTPLPPPAPPQVHAAFGIQSVVPGKAVLDASASTPAGTSAESYSWRLTGGSAPDAVCQGSEPQITVQSSTALNTTVSLTAVDATGASTTAQLPLNIPGPALHTGAKASVAAVHVTHAPAALGKLVTPTYKLISTCASKGAPVSMPYKSAVAFAKSGLGFSLGGAPPSNCLEDTEFGAADIEGCLNQVAQVSEIPGGVTIGLSKLLCGAKLSDFCIPALSEVANRVVSSAGSALGIEDSARRSLAHAALTLPPPAKQAISEALLDQHFPVEFSTTPIRVNGLDIDPQNGFPILIMPGEDLIVAVDAKVYLHNVPLAIVPALVLHMPDLGGELGELKLPKSVPIIGSLPFRGSINITLHRAGTKLSNGDTCQFDCAAMAVQAELPGVFSNGAGEGLSAGAVLTADNEQGLELDSFELKVPEADLGGIGVSNLEFKYLRGPDSLHGGVTIDLGPVGDIGGTIDFIHGHFNGAHLEYSAGDGEGIDLGGPIPIFLTRIGGGVTLQPPVIEANGAIAGGPPVLGCALFGIEAEVVVDFEPEFTLNANGTGQFLCQDVSSEYFHLDEAGHIGLGAHVDISFLIFKVSGGFDFDVAEGHFQADGEVNACINFEGEHCLGAEAVVSDRGIGVCGDLGFTHAGGGIQFPDHVLLFFDTCDIGKFRSLGFTTSVHGSKAAASSFTVPRGQKVALIGLVGSGSAPRATLKGPSGRTIVTPAGGYEKTDPDVVISDEQSATKETYVFINHPEAGAWTITPSPGSSAITSIQQGASLPDPSVHASVSSARGGRDRLSYSLHPYPGQVVEFAERLSDRNFRILGKARGGKGSIVFAPSAARGSKRTIEAMVSQDGHPREDVTVARFRVGRAPSLKAPGHLRLKRHGEKLTIAFEGVKGAAGYAVGVKLSDGRSLYLKLSAKHREVVIPSVAKNIGGSVQVAALMPGTRVRAGRHARLSFKGRKGAGRIVVRTTG